MSPMAALRRIGVTLLALAVVGALGAAVSPVAAAKLSRSKRGEAEIVGRASVIDGDTLEIHGERIRLSGIDAPEQGQRCRDATGSAYRCGQTAALALDGLIGGTTVRCEVSGQDRYRRALATCRAGDGDLGDGMVRAGWAVAYRRYSEDYVGAEDEARRARRGLWAGTFDMPWEWRRARR